MYLCINDMELIYDLVTSNSHSCSMKFALKNRNNCIAGRNQMSYQHLFKGPMNFISDDVGLPTRKLFFHNVYLIHPSDFVMCIYK